MSAFDRHPRRAAYEAARASFGLRPGMGARKILISAQNRKLRYAVDLTMARAKEFPCRETRQMRRQVARLGISSFIPNQPLVGPDEV